MVKDEPGQGIHFGPDGLAIPLQPGSERTARSSEWRPAPYCAGRRLGMLPALAAACIFRRQPE